MYFNVNQLFKCLFNQVPQQTNIGDPDEIQFKQDGVGSSELEVLVGLKEVFIWIKPLMKHRSYQFYNLNHSKRSPSEKIMKGFNN